MSQKYLKTDTLDIHAGGRDLVFPHHENEIAQAEALTGKPFANYWIHHGLLTINAQKMSKSLGNFITIQDVLKKYPADVLKILYLQAHYRSPVDFSWEKMEEAKKALIKLLEAFDEDLKIQNMDTLHSNLREQIEREKKTIDVSCEIFNTVMDDDFNTPQALGFLFGLASDCNVFLNKYRNEHTPDYPHIIEYIRKKISLYGEVLGLTLAKRNPHDQKWASSEVKKTTTEAIDDNAIQQLIEKRLQYKKAKNFSEADRVRKELEAQGIELKDTKDGKTTWEWRR
jgi:cysteinyl-tRNA synthetase